MFERENILSAEIQMKDEELNIEADDLRRLRSEST